MHEGIEAKTGYSMKTVFRRLFRSRLWKVTYRCPEDYPIYGHAHIIGNLYWRLEKEDQC